jgi:hypothetical protein
MIDGMISRRRLTGADLASSTAGVLGADMIALVADNDD